jgi:hypothetical protein
MPVHVKAAYDELVHRGYTSRLLESDSAS